MKKYTKTGKIRRPYIRQEENEEKEKKIKAGHRKMMLDDSPNDPRID